MRIAVAAEEGRVAGHFGRCPEYVLFDVNGTEPTRRQVVATPGHQPGRLPGYLADLGVTHVIAGGMGPRAQTLFARQGIETLVGVAGEVDEAVRAFLEGHLEPGETTCDHPYGEHHGEDHHERR